jgi:hypothetical protein
VGGAAPLTCRAWCGRAAVLSQDFRKAESTSLPITPIRRSPVCAPDFGAWLTQPSEFTLT